MNMFDSSMINRLEKMSVELSDVVAQIRGRKPVFSVEAAEKVARRICLCCGEQVPPKKRYVRGQCAKDEATTREILRSRDATEFELISWGYLAPETPGGRKPKVRTKLHELLEEKRRNPPPHTMGEIEHRAITDLKKEVDNNHPSNHKDVTE